MLKPRRCMRFVAVLLCLTLPGVLLAAIPDVAAAVDADRQTTVLVTGANRGIGLEFVRQYAARGWRVIATCRSPDSARELNELAARDADIRVEQLDVTDAASIEQLRAKYADEPIDLLINNAALLGARAEQSFAQQDFELAMQQYEVNALGPLRVSQAFLDNVRAAGPGKIIMLGSAAGSHGYLRPPAADHKHPIVTPSQKPANKDPRGP